MQCVVGGTNIDSEIRKMRTNVPDILVATPGRLVDHFENKDAGNFMTSLDTLVFDEADRLLDMGFRYITLLDCKVCPEGVGSRLPLHCS